MKKIAKNIYVKTTESGYNLGLIVGEDGVVCVDLPASAPEARAWRAQIAEVSHSPVRSVVFTSAERANGDALQAFNAPSLIHDAAFAQLHSPIDLTQLHGLEGVLPQVLHDHGTLPEGTFSDSATVVLAGKQLVYVDITGVGGCAPGAAYVTVRDSGVVFVGEHVAIGQPPALADADFAKWTEALIMLRKNKKVAVVVPSRGPVGDLNNVSETQDYIKNAMARVKVLVKNNRSRADVATLVPDLLSAYALKQSKLPVKSPMDIEVVQRIVRGGLERIYDDLKQEIAASQPVVGAPPAPTTVPLSPTPQTL